MLDLSIVNSPGFVPPAWAPTYPSFDKSIAELYPLFSDNTVSFNRHEYEKLPSNARFTDQIVARLILEGVPNVVLKKYFRFDFVNDSNLRKGRPQTGPPAFDQFGRLYRFRGYAFCGEASHLLDHHTTVYVDIEKPGVRQPGRVRELKKAKRGEAGLKKKRKSLPEDDDEDPPDDDDLMDIGGGDGSSPGQPAQTEPKKPESQVLLEALCALYSINSRLRDTLSAAATTLYDVQNNSLQPAADSLGGPANSLDLGRLSGAVVDAMGVLKEVEDGLEEVVRGNRKDMKVVGRRFEESGFEGTWESVRHPGRLLGGRSSG
ncbi:MAG: hypothetical protein M1839_000768 [Geoglossum umbratile]|nr:MAG: hypothetical protein M1839_000768 [Geoglossum umbratile]